MKISMRTQEVYMAQTEYHLQSLQLLLRRHIILLGTYAPRVTD